MNKFNISIPLEYYEQLVSQSKELSTIKEKLIHNDKFISTSNYHQYYLISEDKEIIDKLKKAEEYIEVLESKISEYTKYSSSTKSWWSILSK